MVDLFVQPILTTIIEVALWYMVFASITGTTLGGYPKEMYLSYAIWATFMGRIASNWMYEFNMMNEIETGTVNSILVRPVGFYEYYLSQFLGYKWMCLVSTFWLPFLVCWMFDLPVDPLKVPIAMILVAFYMVFVHTLSFLFASMAFFFNRIHSLSVGKNIVMWVLVGELFPLDLMPEQIKNVMLKLPPAAGVYLPVGYITGRVEWPVFAFGFLSVTIGILFLGAICFVVWNRGRKVYSGTGA